MKKRKRKWMSRAFTPENKGKLHRRLHVPEGEKIPESKLESAAHSSDPEERKEAALAKTGKRFAHKKHHRGSRRSSRR